MNSNDQISLNFCYSEFTASRIAEGFHIDNSIPSEYVKQNIHALVTLLLQPLREACGHELKVNSGYRCKKLNDLVGGSKNSQHTKGQAADIASDAPIRLARIVINRGLDFDQMILYPNFIHLSYTLERANRKQILYGKDYYGPKLQML